MNPQLLVSMAALVVVLPPVIDEEIKAKVTNAFAVMLLTMLAGLVAAGIGAACTQVANGSTWKDAATVAGAGVASGVLAGLRNYFVTLAAAKKEA